jgi:hypothetical protein
MRISIGFEPKLMSAQGEFDFSEASSTEGHARWMEGRQLVAAELARRVGLPIGHEVEVWLRGGVRLRGRLQLQEQVQMIDEERLRHLEMLVDHVPFAYRDMDSCIRTD